METLKLSDFKTVSDQLRELSISDQTELSFDIKRRSSVAVIISRIKKEGLDFKTRKHDNKIYVWRTA